MPRTLERMDTRTFGFKLILVLGLVQGSMAATGLLQSARIHIADNEKRGGYLSEGLILGGDPAIDRVQFQSIRFSSNPRYERVVLDFSGSESAEATAIKRPSYFQVELTPEVHRVVVTVFGQVRLLFDPEKTIEEFKKSKLVQRVVFLPALEKDRYTFALELKKEVPVEIFELSGPARLILDLKSKS